MNDLLIAGFADREAAALEIMVGREDPRARRLVLGRPDVPGIPVQDPAARACGQCIVDMAGMGINGYSPGHERQLLEFLDGRSAVLVTAAASAWRERRLPLASSQELVWVESPSKASDVMAALRAIRRVGSSPTGVAASSPGPREVSPRRTDDAIPAWQRAMAFAERKRERADAGARGPDRLPDAAGAGPGAKTQTRTGADGLTRLAAGVSMASDLFPQLSSSRALQAAEAMLASGGLLKLSPPGGHASTILLNPRDGWIASRLTAYAVRSLVPAPGLFDASILQPVGSGDVNEALDRGFGPRRYLLHPLDDLMWELMYGDVAGTILRRRGDIALSIVNFPNFNAIKAYDNIDMRLATICARAPVPLATLEDSFPRHKQAVRRFAAAALVSGCAVAGTPSGRAPATAGEGSGRSRNGATRGFFLALLDRLF